LPVAVAGQSCTRALSNALSVAEALRARTEALAA